MVSFSSGVRPLEMCVKAWNIEYNHKECRKWGKLVKLQCAEDTKLFQKAFMLIDYWILSAVLSLCRLMWSNIYEQRKKVLLLH